jgi:hypothetical protein
LSESDEEWRARVNQYLDEVVAAHSAPPPLRMDPNADKLPKCPFCQGRYYKWWPHFKAHELPAIFMSISTMALIATAVFVLEYVKTQSFPGDRILVSVITCLIGTIGWDRVRRKD